MRGLPTDLPGVETGRSPIFCVRRHVHLRVRRAIQKIDDPVRTGREVSTPTDKKRLKIVERLFRQAASTEAETRPAGRRVPRRFIGVNVIFNKYWPVFTDYVGANINPFCSQILAGIPKEDPTMKGRILRFRGRHAI